MDVVPVLFRVQGKLCPHIRMSIIWWRCRLLLKHDWQQKKSVEITNHLEGQQVQIMPGVLSPFSNSITWNDVYIFDMTVDVNWGREVRKSLLYSLLMAHNLLSVMSSITLKVIFSISGFALRQKSTLLEQKTCLFSLYFVLGDANPLIHIPACCRGWWKWIRCTEEPPAWAE